MAKNKKILDAALNMQWAMTPEALEQIFQVINKNHDPEKLAKVMHGRPEAAIMSAEGQEAPETSYVTLRGDVAVMSLNGPIFPRANLMTEFSGAVSLEKFALEFNEVLNQPGIKAIVLDIDSPGGAITGVSEFSEMLRNARGKDKKIVAYASGLMASAAYWIGSAADEIYLNKTSLVGSIGTVMGVRSKDDDGVIEVVSAQSPLKRADVNTNEGRESYQALVDRLTDVFVATVAQNRNVEESFVLENFGRGGLVVGADAVAVCMADGINTLEGVIEKLTGNGGGTAPNGGFQMSDNSDVQAQVDFSVTVEAVKDSYPDVYQSIFESGVKAERGRIEAIEAIKAPGFESVIAENKFKPEATKESVSVLILEAQEKSRAQNAVDVNADAEDVAEAAKGVQGGGGEADADERQSAISNIVAGADGK